MADEPARAVLSVVRFTQLKNNYGCKTKFSYGDDERVSQLPAAG